MTQPESPHIKPSCVIIGTIIALLTGIFAPYIAIVPIVPVVVAFLYAYAGLIPAAACAFFTLGAYSISFGMMGALAGLFAHIAPAVLIARGVRMRLPFFGQMKAAVASLAFGTVAALTILYAALGSNLIGAASVHMRDAFEAMAETYPGFIDMIASLSYGIPGAPQSVTPELLLSGFLTAAQRASYVDALLSDMQTALALTLPGHLLSMAALAGVISVACSGYIRRNAPGTTELNYVPLARWYTPYGITFGLIATLGVSYLLFAQGVKGGDTLYMTIRAILGVVFSIQAAASIERRMRMLGARTWVRVVVILLIELVFGELALYYGGASALIGSRGAFRQLMEKRANRQ